MHHLSIDIETFSSVDLQKSGMYKYAQSPDFQILLFAFSFDNSPVQIIDLAQGEFLPDWIICALQDPDVIKHAWNAPFEWYCLNRFYYTPLTQWRCSMLHALYCGYPGKLASASEAVGLSVDKKKMGIGMSLIRTFCVPCKPTKTNGYRTRTLPHHEPERWNLFKTYCIRDVVAEMAVDERLESFPVPEHEQELWVLDQQINAYGVAVDRELIEGALYCNEVTRDELMAEASEISKLDNPNSPKQLMEWLNVELDDEENDGTGEATNEEAGSGKVTNLTKATVKKLLDKMPSDKVKRMLEIRQELSKTSVKKYNAMREAVCTDGRIRGLLQFYGANRTGRDAGRLVQIQNLPQNHLETLNHARECVKNKNLIALKLIYGNIPNTLSQLIRTAFIPSPGHVFIPVDFSAIEARVIAWLAGEQWRLDVFNTHGKIYEASASQMFGVPLERIVKGNPEYALRPKGKVSELALGYQGASGALIKMGALEMGLNEEELPEIVRVWREVNKRIVSFWYASEAAAVEVVQTGRPVGVRNLIFARESDSRNGQDFMTIQLPSRRKLFYVKPHMRREQHLEDDPDNPGKKIMVTSNRESLHYWGMDQKTKKWSLIPTYGGKLAENITQAVARDCLFAALERLSVAGHQTAFHVHDESVLDIRAEVADLNRVCDIMGQPIPWAPGLPLKAAGFVTNFYKKDD